MGCAAPVSSPRAQHPAAGMDERSRPRASPVPHMDPCKPCRALRVIHSSHSLLSYTLRGGKLLYQLWLILLSLPAHAFILALQKKKKSSKSKSLDSTPHTYSWPQIFLSCLLLCSFSNVNHVLHFHVFPLKLQCPFGWRYGILAEPSRH